MDFIKSYKTHTKRWFDYEKKVGVSHTFDQKNYNDMYYHLHDFLLFTGNS